VTAHRIAVVSDLHGNLPEVPACDLLLIAGDVLAHGRRELDRQRPWAEGVLRPWLEALPAGQIVTIAGNRDFLAANDPDYYRSLPWTYLDEDEVTACGLRIYGTAWTPEHGQGVFMTDEAELTQRLARVPAGTDVLLTHSPPLGTLDRTLRDGSHVGSPAVAACLDRVRPRLCCFGHIHECHGSEWRGETLCVNAAVVDRWFARAHGATLLQVTEGAIELTPAPTAPGVVVDPPFFPPA
jgi:Icc-related predicted phosphoesterase